MTICVGVDGCKAGWVAVLGDRADGLQLEVFADFPTLMAALPDAMIAVDMPIGLPERIAGGGRVPEQSVRPMLGQRQSSVFAIPARAVVEMGTSISGDQAQDIVLHKKASALAKTLSEPPKGVSIQAFYLFPKILEIDAMLRSQPTARARVYESHPEVAFCVLNGGHAMQLPKKIKGKVNQPGMMERRGLLARYGVDADFLHAVPPKGVGQDDVLDAAVCWLVAQRVLHGSAQCFPTDPVLDGHGIRMGIWA